MVVLEILGTKIEDSGTYTCRATNKWGRAEISVELECIDKSKGQKPQFTTQIQVRKIYFINYIMIMVIIMSHAIKIKLVLYKKLSRMCLNQSFHIYFL